MDKRYDHQSVEKEIQNLWEKEATYAFEVESKKETFSIDTPPPTVSGSLHVGHICSYTQTDIVARYKRMQGFNVFYPMGFDDNGLPTERFVEKKHNIRGHQLKRSEFIKICLEESKLMAEIFASLWKSIGLSIDWDRAYSTISDRARKISQYSFIELYKKGLIYKKEEPALYCTTCRTTVAQAELDDAEVASTFNNIVFRAPDGSELIVATTRPELLPACVALLFNPADERYAKLEGKKARSPLFGREIRIIADELVDREKGSGLVMCCTFGDQTDVLWYKKYALPFIQVVGNDGVWTEAAGPIAGLRVHEARKKILELLTDSGDLKDQIKISHHVSVHERCLQEIEYLVLNQWFVKILDHKDKFLEMAEQIKWTPAFMKARYKDWVENLKWDWCISRQRFYGVQFPVWYCKNCNEVILADEKDLPVDPLEMKVSSCSKCGSKEIIPDSDIMDTWNTSSLTPQINVNWPTGDAGINLPMSLRPQAHDIIRTWTFYTIVKSFYHHKSIPWKNIAVSGYVVAKGGKKISKSKGNAPTDPEVLLQTYPADAIRYWAASGRLGVDTLFSDKQFQIGLRLLTKMWNAFRFCKEQIEACDKDETVKFDALNEWLLTHLSRTVKAYRSYFEEYEYTLALAEAEKFFWHIFCDNYLELVKDRIFNPDQYAADMAATRKAIYETCIAILQLFAPFVPHVTEKLYQLCFKEREKVSSLHKTVFNDKRFNYDFDESLKAIDGLVIVVDSVRKLKSEKSLSLKTELEELKICYKSLVDLKPHEKILKGITQARSVVYETSGADEPSLLEKDGRWYAVVKV
jgi:valyl-tRNA synthetase